MKTWNLIMAAAMAAVFCAGQAWAIDSAGSGYWDVGTTWVGGNMPTSADDVVIKAGHTVTNRDMVTREAKSLTVENTAVLTHQAHAGGDTVEKYKVILSIVSNLTIDAGGEINADGKGYAANMGPGKPVSEASGSHGGRGCYYQVNTHIGVTYGSITAPTNCGSGGKSYAGGGAVRLTVGGAAVVNGTVTANGGGGGSYYAGSGGSVFLTTATLSGSGTIRANGGSVTEQISGGGGRVALVLTQSGDFGGVKFETYAGTAPAQRGAGGTVYLQHTNHVAGQGKLVVDYGTVVPSDRLLCVTTQNGQDPSSNTFAEIVLTNGAVFALDTNDTLDISGAVVQGSPADRNEGFYVLGGALKVPAAFGFTNYVIAIANTNVTFAPLSLTVGTNATFRFDVPWTLGSAPTLEAGSVLTLNAPVHLNSSLVIPAGVVLDHSANANTEANKIDLAIAGDLEIQTNGAINVDGMGYSAGKGPGASAGGSYGGKGGRLYDPPPALTYGSLTAPTNLGSGGAFSGGGAVRLMVSGTTVVDGVISSGGAGGDGYGGSGGSIFLTTGALTGSGTLRAIGGTGIWGWSPGGGGRIAVVLTNSTDFSNVKMQAFTASSGAYLGAGGTVYLETSLQGPGKGTLVIDAGNIIPDAVSSTLISSNVTDTVVGTVIITNMAVFQIDTNQSLTVYGNWENKSSFSGMVNSTVKFVGTNTATVKGHNPFYNLIITNANKVVSFEEGRTNAVNGTLTLAGVNLNSTSGSAAWYLKASANTHSVSNVTVSRSDARPGATIEAYDSHDNGGNFNWVFAATGPATNIWTGTADSDWFKTNNWSLNRTTIFTDTVVIPTNGYNKYPLLDFDKRIRSLAISNGATMSLNSYNLTVDEDTKVAGTLSAVGAATVTVGGNLDFTGGGAFNAASSTVRIVGSNAQTVVSAGNAFYQVTISNSAAPVVFTDAVLASNIVNQATPVTFAGSVTVASAFRTQGTNVTFGGAVTAAIFRNSNGPLVFSGTLTAPAFYSENGALAFSGAVATVSFTNWAGNLTFQDDVTTRDFYCAPGGMALTFKAGKMCSIGNLELYGRGGYPIQLRSSAGSHWYLNVTNRATVRLVDVQYSDASGGQTIHPVAATDSGSNSNWVFDGPWQTWVGTNSAIFTNANNWVPVSAPDTTARVLIDGYYSYAPVFAGTATVAQLMVGGGVTTATLTVNGQLTTLGNTEVLANGTITHSANTISEVNKLKLMVGSNLTIGAGGCINVDGMGYGSGSGPGASAGGSYGGKGGRLYNPPPAPTYGSISGPTNCGSGGAFPGGGAVRLVVSGTTVVDGVISSGGAGGNGYGGSGGSVFLTTGALTGSGTLRAIGGTGIWGWSSGGGGRIAVVLTNSMDFSNVKMQAFTASSGAYLGAGGTVYLETSLQGPGKGTLVIDAGNIIPDAVSSTLISSNVTDTVVGTVIITNMAVFQIDTNQSLTVNGSWINKASFVAMTNSTVEFTGAEAATILTSSSNAFYNLVCTNAGKTLVFDAGRTNTVNGLLKLGALQSGQMVTLRSTTNGSWSYLILTPGGTQAIARVNVKDNNAGGGQTLLAGGGSANGGNNINWQFPPSGTMFMVK